MNESESPSPSKVFKPPPIYISKSNTNVALMKEIIGSFNRENVPLFKTMSDEILKIQAPCEMSYRKVRDLLNQKKISYFTHQLKRERPYRVVIRGLHPQTETAEIIAALAEKNHKAREVVNVIIHKRKDPSNKSSEKVQIHLPLFFVSPEISTNNKQVYELTTLLHQRITVEAPHAKKEIPHYKNCQQFGHTRTYCKKSPKCVKCGEGHTMPECQKSKKAKAKCANCSGNHTANWKGCETYQLTQAKRYTKPVTAVDRIHNTCVHASLTNGKTFADATKTNAIQLQVHPDAQTSLNTNDAIIHFLQSIQQSIANLDLRLMKLETAHSSSSR